MVDHLRQNTFFPARLGYIHRRMRNAPKTKSQLLEEPFYVEVGKEKFRLLPRDPDERPPKLARLLTRMMSLMEKKTDWDILPDLLTELTRAKVNVKKRPLGRFARMAAKASAYSTILECVKQGHSTGFILRDIEDVNEVMRPLYQQAMWNGWSEEDTHRGIRYAEQIAQHLDRPAHCGDGTLPPGQDPRVQPSTIGLLLLLSAVRATKHLNGQDTDQRVMKYSECLKKNWFRASIIVPDLGESGASAVQNAADIGNDWGDDSSATDGGRLDGSTASASPSGGASNGQRQRWMIANHQLQVWAPVWKAMDVASRVENSGNAELTAWLRKTADDLHEQLEQIRPSAVFNDSATVSATEGQPEAHDEDQATSEYTQKDSRKGVTMYACLKDL